MFGWARTAAPYRPNGCPGETNDDGKPRTRLLIYQGDSGVCGHYSHDFPDNQRVIRQFSYGMDQVHPRPLYASQQSDLTTAKFERWYPGLQSPVGLDLCATYLGVHPGAWETLKRNGNAEGIHLDGT